LVCLPGFCQACTNDATGNNTNNDARLVNCCTADRQQENNPMCAQCIDGLVGIGNDCKVCNKANGGTIALLLIVSFIFLFIFHRASQASQKTSEYVLFSLRFHALIHHYGNGSLMGHGYGYGSYALLVLGFINSTQQFLYFMQMLIIFFGPESGWISVRHFTPLRTRMRLPSNG
jgi:hypothetical protein